MRLSLESGHRGDGVRSPWMALMRKEGVKRALIVVSFDWDGKARNMRVVQATYYSKYDTDCAQITDVERLRSIRTSGIDRQLTDFALSRTASSRWLELDNPHPHVSGFYKVYAFDDEWLPKPSSNFVDAGPGSSLHFPAGFFEDEAAVARFTSSKMLTQAERDIALFEAVDSVDDSCVIKALAAAGADLNPHNKYGTTPLSIAVGGGEASNVRALLELGADPNVRDNEGKTPLWNAEQGNGRSYPSVIQLLKQHGAKY
jgi:hypothetical protein